MRHIIYMLIISVQFLGAGSPLTTGFEFLRTDFNPRTAAMAGSFLTMQNDLNALFINPAGMADIERQSYSFNYTNYVLDINGGTAAYNRILPKFGVLTVGIQYMDFGDFKETNEFAGLTGDNFGAQDLSFMIGLADHLSEDFTYGVAAKYIYSRLDEYSASAVALDFGLLWMVPFVEDLNLGVTLKNLGTNFAYYDKTKMSMPLDLRFGVSKKLAHLPLEIALSLNDMNRSADDILSYLKRFSIGGEFKSSEMLRLRLGYDYDLQEGMTNDTDKKFGGLSAGIGILWNDFRFDYAYSNFSILGNIHRFGLSGAIN